MSLPISFTTITLFEYGLIVASYLIGSISTAIIVCKVMSLPDPRTQGSGNPGATNVLRVGGKKAAAITLIGDLLKGLLPVLIASQFTTQPLVPGLVGLAAFLGHLYPVFFGFKGGKGVATMLGVLLGLNFWAGLATALSWLIMAKVFKVSSLSALVATILAPIYLYLLKQPVEIIWIVVIIAIILFWRHRSNIQRLISGEESTIGKSKQNN